MQERQRQGNLITYVIIALIVVGLGSIALMLTVQNRPGPEDEATIDPALAATSDPALDVVGDPALINPTVDPASVQSSQALVAYSVDVAGMPVQILADGAEQVRLVPEVIQPIEEQPVQEQPPADQTTTEQPPADQPIEQQPVPTQEIVIPTAVPTTAPAADVVTQPVVVGQANTGVEQIIFTNHTVVQGETLYSLTTTYATSIELMARYGIASDNMVPGTVLSVPIANPAYCPNMTAYIVREKETAYSIAHRFGVELTALRSANFLNENYNINVSQVLCIP